jgi:beta-lactamase class A
MAFGIFVCLIGLAGLLVYLSPAPERPPVARARTPALEPRLSAPEPPPERVAKNLEAELERVAERYPASYGVVVSDPYSGETVKMNPDQVHLAASLSKLPTLLTLYRAAASGTVDLDAPIIMQASDVQAYGTGVLYRYPVGTTMSLRECAGFLIKESDNTAEVMLNRYLGEANIEAELRRAGARSTSYWMPNTTTPNDVMVVLKAIADPSYTSPELSAEMLDMMTDTSFEDRLPEPLPEDARVAHKIGSWESTFSDAGIVLPEGTARPDQGYYVVVFSEGTTEAEVREAIHEVSLAAYRVLAEPDAR